MSKKIAKQSFLFDYDFLELFEFLEGEEVKQILKDMIVYDRDSIEPNYTDRTLKTIFNRIKKIMDDHKKAYALKCKKNSENQKKRWASITKNDTNVLNNVKNNTKDTNVSSGIKNDTKDTDYDNDYDNNYYHNNNYYNCVCVKEYKCHLNRKFKIEACETCLKNEQCPLKTDPEFILKKGTSFEEWLLKKRNYAEELSKGPPKEESKNSKELFDYNWLDGDDDD